MALVSPVSLKRTALVLKSALCSSCRMPDQAIVGFISGSFSSPYWQLSAACRGVVHHCGSEGCWDAGPQGSSDPKTIRDSARGSSGRAEDVLSNSSF